MGVIIWGGGAEERLPKTHPQSQPHTMSEVEHDKFIGLLLD